MWYEKSMAMWLENNKTWEKYKTEYEYRYFSRSFIIKHLRIGAKQIHNFARNHGIQGTLTHYCKPCFCEYKLFSTKRMNDYYLVKLWVGKMG